MTKGRKKAPEKDQLNHRVFARINTQTYQKLEDLLKANQYKQMSGLIRDILTNRPIRVYTKDQTLDNLMEELSRLRTEIRAIGININQMTRLFNTYPDAKRKEFYAKIAFKEYLKIDTRSEAILKIIIQLSKKWLPE